jgi:hypothetical protein
MDCQDCVADRADATRFYYILNRGAYWWRVDGKGYTQNLDEAWRVTGDKARQICRDRPTEDKAYLASAVFAQSKTIRVVESFKFGEPLEIGN